MSTAEKKGTFLIPFNKLSGEALNYAWSGNNSIVWKENPVLKGTLTYVAYVRGRTKMNFIFEFVSAAEPTERFKVPMFLSDFEELIFHMRHGVVSGTFTFRKHGQNYGLYLMKGSS